METSNLIFSGIKSFDKWLSKDIVKKKTLLLECHFNLRLLEMIKWNGVSQEFINHICKHLQSDTAEMTLSLSDSKIFSFLYDKVKGDDSDSTENKIISLINRIKMIKIISSIPIELSDNNRSNFDVRIKNLQNLLKEIIKELEK